MGQTKPRVRYPVMGSGVTTELVLTDSDIIAMVNEIVRMVLMKERVSVGPATVHY
jgi:hypothetical protein